MRLGLGKHGRVVVIVLAVALVCSIGFLVWDMSRESEASVLEYESEQVEEYLRDNPSSPSAWLELANMSLQQRKYDKAISEFEESLALDEAQPAALMGLGLAHMKKGESDQAVDYLNQAIALVEEDEVLQTGASLATLHYYLGKIYLETGELGLAADELDKALWYDRINADAIYLRGLVYEAQGDEVAAEANYLRALSLVPDYADVYRQLGDIYEGNGDDAMATYYRAMAELFTGSVTTAVEQLTSVMDLLPPNADAFWGLGWGYERLNKMPEAIAAYQQAVAIDPDHRLASGALIRLGVGIYEE